MSFFLKVFSDIMSNCTSGGDKNHGELNRSWRKGTIEKY